MRNVLEDFEIIYLSPMYKPKKVYKRSRVVSYSEMEVLDFGIMFVKYAESCRCELHDNCFTCPDEYADICSGGTDGIRKKKKVIKKKN